MYLIQYNNQKFPIFFPKMTIRWNFWWRISKWINVQKLWEQKKEKTQWVFTLEKFYEKIMKDE
jgi:hypothetical protein